MIVRYLRGKIMLTLSFNYYLIKLAEKEIVFLQFCVTLCIQLIILILYLLRTLSIKSYKQIFSEENAVIFVSFNNSKIFRAEWRNYMNIIREVSFSIS